jgi:hypothetical protein
MILPTLSDVMTNSFFLHILQLGIPIVTSVPQTHVLLALMSFYQAGALTASKTTLLTNTTFVKSARD